MNPGRDTNFPLGDPCGAYCRARQWVALVREANEALEAQGVWAVPIQAIFRGFLARKQDTLVRVSGQLRPFQQSGFWNQLLLSHPSEPS